VPAYGFSRAEEADAPLLPIFETASLYGSSGPVSLFDANSSSSDSEFSSDSDAESADHSAGSAGSAGSRGVGASERAASSSRRLSRRLSAGGAGSSASLDPSALAVQLKAERMRTRELEQASL
jgi:hypothetical protein